MSNECRRLGEILINGLPETEHSLMIEMQNFDRDCAKYDFEAKEAKSALLRMTSIMASPGTEQDPEMRAAVYWDILKNELSPSSITKVCKKAVAGNIGSPKWLPAPGELIRFANDPENYIQYGKPIQIDPRLGPSIKPRLAAPEHKRLGCGYDDAERRADEYARIGHQFRNFAAEMRSGNNDLRVSEKQDYTRCSPPIYSRQELMQMDEGQREKQRIAADAYLESVSGKPLSGLSSKALGKPCEFVRSLRQGSKWVLPA